MSQKAALRALDASLVDAFVGAGLADTALYTPPGGAGIPCRVLVDDEAQFFGEGAGEVAGHRTLVGLFLAEVPTPERGALVVADGQTYMLASLETRDASLERWVVTRG